MPVSSAAPVRRGLLLLAIAASAWGSSGPAAEILYRTTGLGPIAVCWWRVLIAAVALTLTRRRGPRTDWRRAVPIGIGCAVAQSAYYGAIADVGVAVATVIAIGAGPLLVAIGARFALGERLARTGWCAALAAVAGLVLLTGGAGTAGPHPVAGVALAFLAAVAQAATTVGGRTDTGADTTAVCWIAAIALAPLALAVGVIPAHGTPVATIGWLCYLGVVPTALAYRMFFAGLVTVPATIAAVITVLEPLTAAVIAVGVLGERLTALAVVGAIVLLAAVTMISVASGRHRK